MNKEINPVENIEFLIQKYFAQKVLIKDKTITNNCIGALVDENNKEVLDSIINNVIMETDKTILIGLDDWEPESLIDFQSVIDNEKINMVKAEVKCENEKRLINCLQRMDLIWLVV